MKSIRSKIFSGVIFLFVIIVALSVIDIIFINNLAESSKGEIIDNYRTINYTTNMLSSLDEMYIYRLQIQSPDSVYKKESTEARISFEKNLSDEASNITEPGEKELVDRLTKEYSTFLDNLNSSGISSSLLMNNYLQVREIIGSIYSLNMTAVVKKNSNAGKRAEEVTFYTLVAGITSVIMTLFFILTFPARIIKPVRDLTDKIMAISRKDYNQKIEVNTNDEIGKLAGAFNVMAERLKEYENKSMGEILIAKQRLEVLVHNMQDGILVLDHNNKIVLANQVLAELSGLKTENLLNKNIEETILGNEFLRSIVTQLAEKKKTDEDSKNIIRVIRGKKEYYYEPEMIQVLTGTKINGEENPGNMIILKNVTRFEERDAAKTKLISTVSHEMKTPISSINLTVKLLEDSRVGELNNEQKELLHAIREQSNRLSKVVAEILNYSQIETGNIRLNFSPVQPEDIIDYATTALMILLSEKNIQLETEIESNLPSINIDIEKTVWVLVNLLSNAIRYSDTGGKIIISVHKEENHVLFSVKDFGSGITVEDQKKLFSRFTQVGQKSQRGWGIGLAISRDFVQAQGGKMKVESQPGKGSKFTFMLPV